MKLGNEEWLTVAEAARQSGYSVSMIQRLLREKRIQGIKVGRDWLTTLAAVKQFKKQAQVGRPKNN